MLTVRDIIKDMQQEIQKGDLQAPRAAEMLTELSALIGNCNDAIRISDLAYNKILLKWLDIETKANRAKIQAETTPEYDAKQIARNTKELALEMIRSLKYFVRQKEDEYRNTRNM